MVDEQYYIDETNKVFSNISERLKNPDGEDDIGNLEVSRKTVECLEFIMKSSGKTADKTIRDLLMYMSSSWLITKGSVQKEVNKGWNGIDEWKKDNDYK